MWWGKLRIHALSKKKNLTKNGCTMELEVAEAADSDLKYNHVFLDNRTNMTVGKAVKILSTRTVQHILKSESCTKEETRFYPRFHLNE